MVLIFGCSDVQDMKADALSEESVLSVEHLAS
jgi:hypothetical protein